MTHPNETRFRDNSYEQLQEKDFQTLMASIEHNVQQIEAENTEATAANIFNLAAIFNNFAYIGGTTYVDPTWLKTWATQIIASVSMYQWEVVWGPVWHYPGTPVLYESDACMFVARSRTNPDDMIVVLRGTNFLSMDSWLYQDFDTGVMVPLTDLVPNAPTNATVARGTHTGTSILAALFDNQLGFTVSQYLSSLKAQGKLAKNVFITGHSLGGTLTPPFFTFLNYWINNGVNGASTTLIPISFAGLTPGGASFNNYFGKQLDGVRFYRFVNSLDIAPYCWWSKNGVLNIYADNSGNGCGTVHLRPTLVIDELFWGIEGWYQEIPTKVPLAGHCSQPYDLWETLALYQHHVTTYLALMVGSTQVQELWENHRQGNLTGELA